MTPFRFIVLAACTAGALSAELSPAEQAISRAERALQRAPAEARLHNDLALALTRRARETSDPAYYQQARQELARSLELEPENYGALRIDVWALLGQHEFARALEGARRLEELAPDDLLVAAFLTDALVELGRYEEAAESAQWLLDLRPGAIPGLTRAAYLRELHGYVEGAAELLQQALDRTPPRETEDRAWLLVQLARLERGRGLLEAAERTLEQAFELFPGYHHALAELGRLRLDQGRPSDAVEAFERRYDAAPHPENLADLADALEAAGRTSQAREAYRRFEALAASERASADNSNHELVFYYADVAERPAEALAVAREELERRRDVFTRQAYAWALYRSGELSEALAALEPPLALGLRDVDLYYRAGVIAAATGDERAAAAHWRRALEINPRSRRTAELERLLGR